MALYSAARYGDTATVTRLLAEGAAADALDGGYNRTPLLAACDNNNPSTALVLLQVSVMNKPKFINSHYSLLFI